jgi:hypothetical protein
MTGTTPVERVSDMLSNVGYKRITSPMKVGGLPFDFPAVFVGTGSSPDLIIIVDTAFDKEQRIQQKVEGLARALDVLRSRRPLTAIVVGPRPRNTTLDGLSRVCRVLPMGSASQEGHLENWLAVLLPLNLPEPQEDTAGLSEDRTGDEAARDPVIQSLVGAARISEEATRDRLHALIAEPFEALDNESNGGI